MLWLNTHARARKRISPYIDGQLSPRERTTLEAHLAGCDACRRELDELRATISVVGGMAEVEPARSFALTPPMLERRAATPPASVPPFATGMRLAGAGVALVLAVVLVGDLGVVGNDGGSREETGALRQAAEFRMTDSDSNDAGAGAPAPGATGAAEEYATIGADQASPDDLAASADNAEACSSAAAGGGAGEQVTATPEAEPTPESTLPAAAVPSLRPAGEAVECAPVAANVAPEQESPAAGEAMRDSGEDEIAAAPESVANDDGGVSTLTVVEIILAGGLVALVGAIGIEYMLRRRAA